MEEGIFRITKDIERAKDLLIMSKERQEMINLIPKDKTYKIIEDYYEIILELMTAIMYCDGYKTLNHVDLINYISANCKKELNESQIRIIDTIRKSRHGIVYYGRKITADFLFNNEQEINKIITILNNILEKRLVR